MATIHRTLAEQEVTFRWDQDARLLWAGTTTPRVACRWTRAGYPLRVLGRVDGEPASWEIALPWGGQRRRWFRLFGLSLPDRRTGAFARAPMSRPHDIARANGPGAGDRARAAEGPPPGAER